MQHERLLSCCWRLPACAEAAADIPALLQHARTWVASQHEQGGGPTSGVNALMGVGAGQAGVAQPPSGPVEHSTGSATTSYASQVGSKSKGPSGQSSKGDAAVVRKDPGTHQGLGAPLELVVDGRSLGHILPDTPLRRQLAQLCAL